MKIENSTWIAVASSEIEAFMMCPLILSSDFINNLRTLLAKNSYIQAKMEVAVLPVWPSCCLADFS